ncbi:cyclic-phosphate processing receiver domain-containing protein [Cohnella nanjingensis]|uniref:Cell division protein FtsJ n=1 Tax=Cohnella nanjingensis TaxID=1387779 RepID=A0A7X0VE43_9BACL|nr:cyclic-phosphate processing receiver domain-containing protein [Cohnella nanjingensis]MBB6669174.1 cell division protein FtsJ [Cohnella nanjingensis]
MINVYLDDVRPCPKGFVAARSAEECLLLLAEYEVNVLSLDFELGIGLPNGLAVVHGMIAAATYPASVYVHSSSMMGRAQMVHALRQAQPPGVDIHDGPMPADVLEAAARADASGWGN